MTVRQKDCKERLYIHNPTKEGRGVNRRPTKMDPTHLSAERNPSTTDSKLERDPKLKVQDHNFIRKCEETRHKKSVRLQEGNKIHYFIPHHPVLMETGSTRRNRIAPGRILKPSFIQQRATIPKGCSCAEK
jgi:hypothetical protein